MICLKCCYKSEAIAQLSSIKMRFCKTSQISQKTFTVESLFRKPVRPQACNSTKKNTVAGVFLWIYLCKYIFSFSLFFSEKTNAATGDLLWKKVFLKISQIYRETPVLEFFLIKLQVFKNALLRKPGNDCLEKDQYLFNSQFFNFVE